MLYNQLSIKKFIKYNNSNIIYGPNNITVKNVLLNTISGVKIEHINIPKGSYQIIINVSYKSEPVYFSILSNNKLIKKYKLSNEQNIFNFNTKSDKDYLMLLTLENPKKKSNFILSNFQIIDKVDYDYNYLLTETELNIIENNIKKDLSNSPNKIPKNIDQPIIQQNNTQIDNIDKNNIKEKDKEKEKININEENIINPIDIINGKIDEEIKKIENLPDNENNNEINNLSKDYIKINQTSLQPIKDENNIIYHPSEKLHIIKQRKRIKTINNITDNNKKLDLNNPSIKFNHYDSFNIEFGHYFILSPTQYSLTANRLKLLNVKYDIVYIDNLDNSTIDYKNTILNIINLSIENNYQSIIIIHEGFMPKKNLNLQFSINELKRQNINYDGLFLFFKNNDFLKNNYKKINNYEFSNALYLNSNLFYKIKDLIENSQIDTFNKIMIDLENNFNFYILDENKFIDENITPLDFFRLDYYTKFSIILYINNLSSIINLKETLDTLIKQNYIDYDIIIINDNTIDKNISIIINQYINTYSTSNIIFINNDKFEGYANSINKGIEISKSEYIYWMFVGYKLLQSFIQVFNTYITQHNNAHLYISSYKLKNQLINSNISSIQDLINRKETIQSFMINRNIINNLGKLNINEKNNVYNEFFLRLFNQNNKKDNIIIVNIKECIMETDLSIYNDNIIINDINITGSDLTQIINNQKYNDKELLNIINDENKKLINNPTSIISEDFYNKISKNNTPNNTPNNSQISSNLISHSNLKNSINIINKNIDNNKIINDDINNLPILTETLNEDQLMNNIQAIPINNIIEEIKQENNTNEIKIIPEDKPININNMIKEKIIEQHLDLSTPEQPINQEEIIEEKIIENIDDKNTLLNYNNDMFYQDILNSKKDNFDDYINIDIDNSILIKNIKLIQEYMDLSKDTIIYIMSNKINNIRQLSLLEEFYKYYNSICIIKNKSLNIKIINNVLYISLFLYNKLTDYLKVNKIILLYSNIYDFDLSQRIINDFLIFDITSNIFDDIDKNYKTIEKCINTSNLIIYSSKQYEDFINNINSNIQKLYISNSSNYINDLNNIQLLDDIKEKYKDKTIIGYVGFVSDLLDYNIIKLIADNKNIHIIICGLLNIKNYDYYFNHPNISWVKFTEHSNIKNIINYFDICLIPYKTEDKIEKIKYHNPSKLYEYMSMNKPIISTIDFNKFEHSNFIYDIIDKSNFNKIIIDIINNLKCGIEYNYDFSTLSKNTENIYNLIQLNDTLTLKYISNFENKKCAVIGKFYNYIDNSLINDDLFNYISQFINIFKNNNINVDFFQLGLNNIHFDNVYIKSIDDLNISKDELFNNDFNIKYSNYIFDYLNDNHYDYIILSNPLWCCSNNITNNLITITNYNIPNLYKNLKNQDYYNLFNYHLDKSISIISNNFNFKNNFNSFFNNKLSKIHIIYNSINIDDLDDDNEGIYDNEEENNDEEKENNNIKIMIGNINNENYEFYKEFINYSLHKIKNIDFIIKYNNLELFNIYDLKNNNVNIKSFEDINMKDINLIINLFDNYINDIILFGELYNKFILTDLQLQYNKSLIINNNNIDDITYELYNYINENKDKLNDEIEINEYIKNNFTNNNKNENKIINLFEDIGIINNINEINYDDRFSSIITKEDIIKNIDKYYKNYMYYYNLQNKINSKDALLEHVKVNNDFKELKIYNKDIKIALLNNNAFDTSINRIINNIALNMICDIYICSSVDNGNNELFVYNNLYDLDDIDKYFKENNYDIIIYFNIPLIFKRKLEEYNIPMLHYIYNIEDCNILINMKENLNEKDINKHIITSSNFINYNINCNFYNKCYKINEFCNINKLLNINQENKEKEKDKKIIGCCMCNGIEIFIKSIKRIYNELKDNYIIKIYTIKNIEQIDKIQKLINKLNINIEIVNIDLSYNYLNDVDLMIYPNITNEININILPSIYLNKKIIVSNVFEMKEFIYTSKQRNYQLDINMFKNGDIDSLKNVILNCLNDIDKKDNYNGNEYIDKYYNNNIFNYQLSKILNIKLNNFYL